MSEVFVTGISHHRAPVELRERLAIDGPALGETGAHLRERSGLSELVILSTCNRVEIYGRGEARAITEWLEQRAGSTLDNILYLHREAEAVRHVFRVAASLDSMVVGEPQILGQIKSAFAEAKRAGIVGSLLERAFTHAFAVAKRVRTETTIAEGSVSVSSIAGDLARKIFGDLDGRRVLLVGAGEMGEMAAKHLRKSGADLYVVNRSRERADRLAENTGGRARGIEALASELATADVVIASTSSQRFVITPELMKGVVKSRRHRPLFMIDIAVPRDIDPRVGDLSNVFLYDVDDLEQVAAENLGQRRRAAERAELIVRTEVAAFESWRRAGSLGPTIVGLRDRVRGVLAGELARTLKRLPAMGPREQQSLDKMLDAMTNKLVHRTIAELKSNAGTPEGHALMQTTKRLFDLDPEPSAESADVALTPALEPATGRGKAS